MGSLLGWLRSLALRRRLEREMQEEMGQHLERATERLTARGLSREDARRAALREFGNVAYLQEKARDARGGRWLESLAQDTRLALRMLGRSPGFTVVMVLTLALGIGANTAIFSAAETVLLKPLPYPHDDQLVELWSTGGQAAPGSSAPVGGRFALSYQEYDEVRQLDGDVSGVAAHTRGRYNLTGLGEPREVQAELVAPSLFQVLDVRPAIGRAFTEAELREPVVVLGHGLWTEAFGGDPEVVGRVVTLDGRGYAVVGVMPAAFAFPDEGTELWVPLGLAFEAQPDMETDPRFHALGTVARLRDGVDLERLDSDLAVVAARLAGGRDQPAQGGERRTLIVNRRGTPPAPGASGGRGAASGAGADGPGAERGFVTRRLRDEVVGDARTPLLVLLGVVGFVLLIACVNAANLLLARAGARERELAVRRALGAGRGRIVRQLLTESILLGGAAGVVGLGFASLVLSAILAAWPAVLPRSGSIGLDGPTLAFALVVSLVTGAAFGLVPALRSSSVALEGTLREGAAGVTAGRQRHRIQRGLVVAEVALALVVLTGAGLLVKSFVRLSQVEPGYDTRGVLATRFRLTPARYPGDAERMDFLDQVVEELRRQPDVESASVSQILPMSGEIRILGIDTRTLRPDDPEPFVAAGFDGVGPDFFRALGIPLLAGRAFSASDRADAQPVAVVNRELANRLWPGQDPIGRTIPMRMPTRRDAVVVGVVGDVHTASLTEPVRPELYIPFAQSGGGGGGEGSSAWIVARTIGAPLTLADAVRRAAGSIDPEQPVATVTTLSELVSRSTASRRFDMTLVGLFALLALGLAVVGIYGVTAYTVEQRVREIGVRVALGAERRDVVRLLLGETAVTAVLGIALGVGGALAATRVLESLLFGVSATDASTFGVTALALAAAALTAALLPALRASRADPVQALRDA